MVPLPAGLGTLPHCRCTVGCAGGCLAPEWVDVLAVLAQPNIRSNQVQSVFVFPGVHVLMPLLPQVEMVSFGVDPQWGGLLFSLCSRHEDAGAVLGAGGGIIFPNILADPLAASSAAPGAPGDLVNVFGSGCLDMYSVSVSSVWAIVVETGED